MTQPKLGECEVQNPHFYFQLELVFQFKTGIWLLSCYLFAFTIVLDLWQNIAHIERNTLTTVVNKSAEVFVLCSNFIEQNCMLNSIKVQSLSAES